MQTLYLVQRRMLAAAQPPQYVAHPLVVFRITTQRLQIALHEAEHVTLIAQSILQHVGSELVALLHRPEMWAQQLLREHVAEIGIKRML